MTDKISKPKKKMDTKIKANWIQALRSGFFKKTTGRLIKKTERGCEFCALGVLAEIQQVPHSMRNDAFKFEGMCYEQIPSDKFLDACGLERNAADRIMIKNDTERRSFKKIADYIEKNL